MQRQHHDSTNQPGPTTALTTVYDHINSLKCKPCKYITIPRFEVYLKHILHFGYPDAIQHK